MPTDSSRRRRSPNDTDQVTAEENKQLTDLLHDAPTMVENAKERRSQLPAAELEQRIDRLGSIPSKMEHGAHENVLELTRPVHNRKL